MRAVLLALLLLQPATALSFDFEEEPAGLSVYPGQSVRLDVSALATCSQLGEWWTEPINVAWVPADLPTWISTTRTDTWSLQPNACANGQTFYHRAYWEFDVAPSAPGDTLHEVLVLLEANGETVAGIVVPLHVRFEFDFNLFFDGPADLVIDEQYSSAVALTGTANDDVQLIVRAAAIAGPYGFGGSVETHKSQQNLSVAPFTIFAEGRDAGFVVVEAEIRHGLETLLTVERNYTLEPAPVDAFAFPDVEGQEMPEEEPAWWPWLIVIVGLAILAIALLGRRRLSTTSESDAS